MIAREPSENKCVTSLREILTLRIEGVAAGLAALKDLLEERDKQYNQRFESADKANIVALTAVREATAAALAAAKEAVAKAESANEKRFESVNEFRSTLRDQQSTLVSKDEVAVRFRAIEDKISSLNDKLELITGQQVLVKGHSEGANWLWVVLIGVAMVGIDLISKLFKP